jgi:acetyltransferase
MQTNLPCATGAEQQLRGERVALRDGGHVRVRPLRQHDRPGVVALLTGLSPESRAQRFLAAGMQVTPAVVDRVTAGRVLVATIAGRVVGLASLHPRHDPTQAEVALLVADREQRRGIGTALSRRLLWEARCAGIRRLSAEIVDSNRGVLALIRTLGMPSTRAHARGVIAVEIDLCP